MNCPLCNNEIPKGYTYTVYGNRTSKADGDKTKMSICGRCFLLTDLNQKLAEVLKWLQSKT